MKGEIIIAKSFNGFIKEESYDFVKEKILKRVLDDKLDELLVGEMKDPYEKLNFAIGEIVLVLNGQKAPFGKKELEKIANSKSFDKSVMGEEKFKKHVYDLYKNHALDSMGIWIDSGFLHRNKSLRRYTTLKKKEEQGKLFEPMYFYDKKSKVTFGQTEDVSAGNKDYNTIILAKICEILMDEGYEITEGEERDFELNKVR